MEATGKQENPEKNPRSMGETGYDDSTHMGSKFENQHGAVYPGGPPARIYVKSETNDNANFLLFLSYLYTPT